MRAILYAILTFCIVGITDSHAGTLHSFGGQTIDVRVGPKEQSCQAISRLLQVSRMLMVPIESDTHTNCGQDLTISVPAVERQTSFVLETEILSNGQKTGKETTEIIAYPADLLGTMRAWSERNIFYTKDSAGLLEAFLKSQNINFISLRPDDLQTPSAKLIAGAGEIYFMEEEDALPKIVIRPRKITVGMMFLSNLAGNPVYQSELLDMFQQLEK
jgi:hypothetical protein